MEFHSFDAEYLRRLKEGDPATEEDFDSYFRQLLYLKLRGRLRSYQLIEDIIQETLTRVLEIVRHGPGVESPEKFGGFVLAVCNNVLREFVREDSRHEGASEHHPDPPDPTVDLDRPLIDNELKRQVGRVLATLPPGTAA